MLQCPSFREIISRHGIQPDSHKLCAPTKMSLLMLKKETQSFLGIRSYLSKYPLETLEICKPLGRMASVKSELTCNLTYQELYA